MCVSPIQIQNPKKFKKPTDPQFIEVPCRYCSECLNDKKNDVLNQLFALYRYGTGLSPYFVTLTYNPESIHINNHGFYVLNYKDIKLFFKKLRYYLGNIKYFCCGEYGTKSSRPHYHIILYVLPYLDKDFIYQAINKSWNKGFIDVSKIRHAGCLTYVSKYVTKPFQFNFSAYGLNAYQDKFKKLNLKEQRKILNKFEIPPQFTRRSIHLIDLLLSSDDFKSKIRLVKQYKKEYYGKIEKCCTKFSEINKVSAQDFLQEVGIDAQQLEYINNIFSVQTFAGKYFTRYSKKTIEYLYGNDAKFVKRVKQIYYLYRYFKSNLSNNPEREFYQNKLHRLEAHKKTIHRKVSWLNNNSIL